MFTDLWDAAYSNMLKTVEAAKRVPNPLVTAEIEKLIGTSPPELKIMSTQMIQSELAKKTIDIGMCGFFITLDRLQNFDYVNPYYFPSGFQAVVKKPTELPSMLDVLNAIVGCVEDEAQLIILIILLFVFIFGQLIAGAEHVAASGGNMKKGYFESTQDGMWFSIVIMSTVGFGDIYPLSVFGRTLVFSWIFLSISFMAMLLAVITTGFLTLNLIPDNPVYHITDMSSLEGFRVVTATNFAYTVLLRSFPEMNLTKFPVTMLHYSHTVRRARRCMYGGRVVAAATLHSQGTAMISHDYLSCQFVSPLSCAKEILIRCVRSGQHAGGGVPRSPQRRVPGGGRAAGDDPVLQQLRPGVPRPPHAHRLRLQQGGRRLRCQPPQRQGPPGLPSLLPRRRRAGFIRVVGQRGPPQVVWPGAQRRRLGRGGDAAAAQESRSRSGQPRLPSMRTSTSCASCISISTRCASSAGTSRSEQ